jgi:hypothetical protein
MAGREKAEFKRTRFLWLTNPDNLRREVIYGVDDAE